MADPLTASDVPEWPGWESWVAKVELGEAGKLTCKCSETFSRLDWADPADAIRTHIETKHLPNAQA